MFRTAIFLVTFLIPVTSIAEPGDFTFAINGTQEVYPSTCIESISYIDNDEIDAENVIFSLSDECGNKLYITTKQNIGKNLSVYYKGNLLARAMIASVLKSHFRLSSKEMPRMVLMQLLNDYGAADADRHPL